MLITGAGHPDAVTPARRLQQVRERRQQRRICYRCKYPINGAPGLDRDGYYHPAPGGCEAPQELPE